jgi:NADPH:quinone reductase-like Zn-dependent oxidoreductase
MKSLRFAEFGPPSVLQIEEVPIPRPGEAEALVYVMAAAINPSDIGSVAEHFKRTTLPRTPGRDFAGIVAKGSITKVTRFGAVLRRSVSSITALTQNTSLSQRRRSRSNQSR